MANKFQETSQKRFVEIGKKEGKPIQKKLHGPLRGHYPRYMKKGRPEYGERKRETFQKIEIPRKSFGLQNPIGEETLPAEMNQNDEVKKSYSEEREWYEKEGHRKLHKEASIIKREEGKKYKRRNLMETLDREHIGASQKLKYTIEKTEQAEQKSIEEGRQIVKERETELKNTPTLKTKILKRKQ